MIYQFLCDTCGPFQVMAPMSQVTWIAQCMVCGHAATKMVTVPHVIAHNTQYSKALGIDLANKQSVDRYKREYADKTGGSLVEAGNERIEARQPSGDPYEGAVKNAMKELS